MRKRMLARTYQPKFFLNMAVGVPEGRCTKTFLAAVSFRVGTAFFIAVDVAQDLSEHSFKFQKKGKQMDNSKTLPRLLNRAHGDCWLYGCQLGELIRHV